MPSVETGLPSVETPAHNDTAAFFDRAIRDASGSLAIMIATVGDRLGLFRSLADGPATAGGLADRAAVSERFALEWARAMTATGYLEHDGGRFAVPASRIPILAAADSPVTLTGILGWVLAISPHLDAVVDGMRSGSGVPMRSYGPRLAEAMARFGAPLYANALVPVWIPAAPELEARLLQGVEVADIGCGAGRAVLEMAEAYPRSRFTGYDLSADQIALAREAERAGSVMSTSGCGRPSVRASVTPSNGYDRSTRSSRTILPPRCAPEPNAAIGRSSRCAGGCSGRRDFSAAGSGCWTWMP